MTSFLYNKKHLFIQAAVLWLFLSLHHHGVNGNCGQNCNCGGVCCYQVEENRSPGVFLGRVQDIPDTEVQDLAAQPNAQFTITTGSEVMSVNANGTLETAVALDRESDDDGCFTTFLQVAVGSNTDTVTLTVKVLDTNDNSPVFSSGLVVNLTVSETSTFPSVLLCSNKLLAVDPDAAENGTIANYTVLSPSQNFTVFLDNVGRLCLRNLVPLDREKQDYIDIIILATDNGTVVQRNSTLDVRLTLSDDNDNPPLFINFTSTLQVLENTPINQTVFTYTATDSDIGTNAIIVYSLSSSSPVPFGLTSNGTLYVSQSLDADTADCAGVAYTFNIILSNPVASSPTTTGTTTVTIVGENDSPPVIELTASFLTSVYEGHVNSTSIAQYSVEDSDCGDGSGFTGSVISGTEYAFLQVISILNTEIYVLNLKDFTIDREKVGVISITILFQDDGSPSMNATTIYNITVLDRNDNPPSLNRTHFTISESTQIGAPIEPLSQFFYDPDNGSNGTWGRFEQLTNRNLITILSNGNMQLEVRPDRETLGNSIQVLVRVYDAGTNPQLSSNITIYINIIDINDNRPIFSGGVKNNTVFNIPENLPPGTLVTQISATDNDNGTNAEVTFDLYPNSSLFHIDTYNGSLYSLQSFDREDVSSYQVVVVATDGGTPPLNNTVRLVINVTDVNDNPPRFNNPSYNFNVSSGSTIGTLIGVVTATDSDQGNNAKILYKTNSEDFNVSSHGSLYLTRSLSSDNSNVTFCLTAYNPSDSNLNDSVLIEIQIISDPSTPSSSPMSQDLIWYVVYVGTPVGGALILAIFLLVCLICTVRCYRHHCQSVDLYKASVNSHATSNHRSSGGIPSSGSLDFPQPKKSILRAVPVAGSRYEDTTGLYKGNKSGPVVLSKSSTVNFKEESEVRFYNTEQALNNSETCTIRVQAEEIELKPKQLTPNSPNPGIVLSDDFTPPVRGTPPIDTKISSPSLSDDLSTSPSMTTAQNHDLSHFYTQHSSSKTLPVLREELLKKHDQEYSFPSALIETPHSEECDIPSSINRMPSSIHGYLSSSVPPHHNGGQVGPPVSNGPLSHFPFQNGNIPSEESSPDPLHYSRSIPHTSSNVPRPHNSMLPYFTNGSHAHNHTHNHAHPPPHGRSKNDMYNIYKQQSLMNGGSSHIRQSSSTSSTSSHHRSPHVPPPSDYHPPSHPPSHPHPSSDYHPPSYHPHPPQTYCPSSSSSSNDYNPNIIEMVPPMIIHVPSPSPQPPRSAVDYRHRHSPPHAPHPLIHILREEDYRLTSGTSSSLGPSSSGPSGLDFRVVDMNGYGFAGVETDDDDTSTVASSVLDQYLQFDPPPLRHQCLSLSVDDMKLSSITRHDSQA